VGVTPADESLSGVFIVATDVNVRGEDRIGGYRFVRMVLPGQNAAIMEVAQEGTGKRFALKQLNSLKGEEASERKAFEFEAKLGLELRHPNMIKVHEYVKDKSQPYFVMDYFPSDHLRLILNKRDRAEWLKGKLHRIIEQTISAIAYMHDKGWIHRDIKPENILVNKSGEVRLIDYALAKKPPAGLSKMFGGKPPREGTHSYMSPEQIRCGPPSIQADIYSLGITCYELACGRQPFRANSPSELLNKHLYEMPSPPTVHNKLITSEYSDLVMRMIKKNPKDRPANLHEVLSQFNRIRIFSDDPEPQAAANAGF
jgi:serine/threonine protein kinase